MVKQLYDALVPQLNYYLPGVKTIRLYNNQFASSNGIGKDGRKEKAFDYPAIFLEFNQFEFRQLSMGVQEFDFEMTVHFGWKTFKTEDDGMLNQLENLYWAIQRFQQGSFARLSRVQEIWDTNHDDVTVTKIVYKGYGKDFNRWVYNTDTLSSITGLTISSSIEFSGDTSNGSIQWSGGTIDNGDNMYQPGSTNECSELPY